MTLNTRSAFGRRLRTIRLRSVHTRKGLLIGTGPIVLLVGVMPIAAPGGADVNSRSAARTWHVQPTPNPSGTEISGLSSISCVPGTTRCTAVGSSSRTLSTITRTLAERWDGVHWRIQPIPTPAGTSDTLYGVSCPSASVCMTVGTAFHSSNRHTTPLTEVWNGKSWRVLASPTVGSRTQLNAISCTSATWCEAVGLFDDSTGKSQAFAEWWNGSTWHAQTAVRPVNSSMFTGVSCFNPHACFAVGSQSDGDTRPLTQWWNGARWLVRAAPVPTGANGGYLSAVSCTSPSACTATGTDFRPGGVTLAERWNGTSWRIQPTPNPSDWKSSFRSVELDGVSCTSTVACTASGEYAPAGNADYFIERWNGGGWRLETTQRPGGFMHGALLAISCTVTRCSAVGAYTRVSLLQSTLAMADRLTSHYLSRSRLRPGTMMIGGLASVSGQNAWLDLDVSDFTLVPCLEDLRRQSRKD